MLRGIDQSGILDTMISRRNPLLRSMAIGLQLCFVWLFAVCVFNCSSHEELEPACIALASDEISSTHQGESDCCPITATPASVIPDRRLDGPQLNGGQPMMIAPPAPAIALVVPHHSLTSITPACTGPPFERLCTLRI